MPESDMHKVIEDVLSANIDVINSKIQKETLISSLHLEASKRGVDKDSRDNHPYMNRLYTTQDGMTFFSYQDIYAFSHDLVESLPKPERMISVSSNEIENIYKILENPDVDEAKKASLIDKHEELVEELNDISLNDKLKGFFQSPKDGVTFISEDKVSKHRAEIKKALESSERQKQESFLSESPKATASSEKVDKTENKSDRRTSNKGRANPQSEQRSPSNANALASMNAASINPVGYAGTALGKFAVSSLLAMGTGLEKSAEWSLSKIPSNKQSFLSGLSQKNHSIVESSIQDNTLLINELSSLSEKKNLRTEEVITGKEMLSKISSNLSKLNSKKNRSVLLDEDRDRISKHTNAVSDTLQKFNQSELKDELEKDGVDVKGIIDSLRMMINAIMKRRSPDQEPSPSP